MKKWLNDFISRFLLCDDLKFKCYSDFLLHKNLVQATSGNQLLIRCIIYRCFDFARVHLNWLNSSITSLPSADGFGSTACFWYRRLVQKQEFSKKFRRFPFWVSVGISRRVTASMFKRQKQTIHLNSTTWIPGYKFDQHLLGSVNVSERDLISHRILRLTFYIWQVAVRWCVWCSVITASLTIQ
jgi:hypothetical protein